jgi:hypothetical protein
MAKIVGNTGSKFEYSLIEKDVYDARIVRFQFIGVQPQRPYQGQAKPDALMAKVAFELIGETVTVTNTSDDTTETRPALVFNDITVPGGGTGRGKAFDLIAAALGADACFDDTVLYKDLMNIPVNVVVGQYLNAKTDKMVNCVDGVSPMSKKNQGKLEDSTVDVSFFDCYEDDEGMKEIFAGLGNFIQGKIKEAKDSKYIPAIMNDWPTTKEEKAADGEADEF